MLIEALSDWVIRAERRGDGDEASLAKRLFDDFSRCDPCSGTGWVGGTVLCKATDDDVIEMSGGFDLDAKPKSKVKPMPPPPPPPRKIVQKPRQAGNQAFAAGDFEQALRHYDAALAEENETAISTLQCNRATCLVKLAARDVSDDVKNKAWLQRAEEACDAALDADPRNSKARYRLAQTLAALGDERLGEAIAAARSARRAIIDEKAGDAQRGAVADLLLALLDRDKATNDKTSRIARGLLRARRGGKGHEMTRGWKKPGTGEKKKAAVQKGFMDPKPRDYASSDDELVVEDVTKPPTEEDASDSDEAPTAVVDAAADSDDDELMAVRKAEDDQRKLRRKARIVAKENKKASEKPSEKAARKAARVQRILKMSMS